MKYKKGDRVRIKRDLSNDMRGIRVESCLDINNYILTIYYADEKRKNYNMIY